MNTPLWLQRLLPQQWLTHTMGKFANSKAPRIKNTVIKWLIKHYTIDMSDYARQHIDEFSSVNDFFTRELKPDARPFDQSATNLCSPCDGFISQSGSLLNNSILQAKGKFYTADDLLMQDESSKAYNDGTFINIYLAPHNYHRVHMPIDGTLKKVTYVAGEFFSVSPTTVKGVSQLFCRNERVLFLFDSPMGPFALVMVGAMMVGSVATAWGGVVDKSEENLKRDLKKGEELGHFLFGSTVIMLFPQGRVNLSAELQPEQALTMGQVIGSLNQ